MPPRHVYVHVPFCARRCTYCDFSIAVRREAPVDEYVTALAREIDTRVTPGSAWIVETLYLGGGTPSRLGGHGVARLIDAVRERCSLTDDAEVTLEANPDDVTADAVVAWRQAGVNRLSIGAQSFDDAVLRWMHRTHDAAAVSHAVERARRGGIDNVSLDLIFALPADVERDWERDLRCALGLEPSHVSLYGLTIEPHTPLGRSRARGELEEAPEERYERDFLLADELLAGAGFEHYEVSNFGRPGLRSRHNSAYWAEVPYSGFGPSAHEFDGSVRRWNVSSYTDWLRRALAGRDPIEQSETLTAENKMAERAYLGLRTSAGLEISEQETERTRAWVKAGWATARNAQRIHLTPLGWLRLDALAADLTLLRSRY